MPTLPFRIAMFSSSYVPLFGLLAYKNRDTPRIWVILGVIAVGSLLGLLVVMLSKRGERGPALTVAHSAPKDADVLAYTAVYLVPFLNVDLAKADGAVILVVFLLVLGVVYVNSSMLFVNPVLSLAGYRSFSITDEDGHEYSLITHRREVEPGASITPAQVGKYLRVEVQR
jgi:hypothetical protein